MFEEIIKDCDYIELFKSEINIMGGQFRKKNKYIFRKTPAKMVSPFLKKVLTLVA